MFIADAFRFFRREALNRRLIRPELALGVFLGLCLVFKFKMMAPQALGPLFLPLIKQDAAIFSAIIILYASAALLAKRSERSLCPRCTRTTALALAVGALLIVAVYFADVFVFYFFRTRLYVGDLIILANETDSVRSIITIGLGVLSRMSTWKIFVIGVGFFFVCWASISLIAVVRNAHRTSTLSLLALAGTLLAVSAVPLAESAFFYGDKQLYENFVRRNMDYLTSAGFTPEFRKKLMASKPDEECHAGAARPVNVILVIVESLSAYHSHFFSGVEDWTPELDQLAQRETALTNFHANGWTTIGGLVSLLSGSFPIPPERSEYNKWGSPRFTDFEVFDRSIVRSMKLRGYDTIFIGGGDLSFLGQNEWLEQAGFDHIIGSDDRRLVHEEVRGPFDAVLDAALYRVALEEIRHRAGEQPYLMVIQTFWSHRPFRTPDGEHADGEETVIRYADAQLAFLHSELERTSALDSALLIITGDHRAMEPFREREITRFGESAGARIPAVVATDAFDLPSVLPEHYQQLDIGPSIEAITGNEYCLRPLEGAFLGPSPTPPGCVLQARGEDRDLVYVRCGGEEGLVKIDGDETRFVSGSVSFEHTVIDAINRSRVRKIQ